MKSNNLANAIALNDLFNTNDIAELTEKEYTLYIANKSEIGKPNLDFLDYAIDVHLSNIHSEINEKGNNWQKEVIENFRNFIVIDSIKILDIMKYEEITNDDSTYKSDIDKANVQLIEAFSLLRRASLLTCTPEEFFQKYLDFRKNIILTVMFDTYKSLVLTSYNDNFDSIIQLELTETLENKPHMVFQSVSKGVNRKKRDCLILGDCIIRNGNIICKSRSNDEMAIELAPIDNNKYKIVKENINKMCGWNAVSKTYKIER